MSTPWALRKFWRTVTSLPLAPMFRALVRMPLGTWPDWPTVVPSMAFLRASILAWSSAAVGVVEEGGITTGVGGGVEAGTMTGDEIETPEPLLLLVVAPDIALEDADSPERLSEVIL